MRDTFIDRVLNARNEALMLPNNAWRAAAVAHWQRLLERIVALQPAPNATEKLAA